MKDVCKCNVTVSSVWMQDQMKRISEEILNEFKAPIAGLSIEHDYYDSVISVIRRIVDLGDNVFIEDTLRKQTDEQFLNTAAFIICGKVVQSPYFLNDLYGFAYFALYNGYRLEIVKGFVEAIKSVQKLDKDLFVQYVKFVELSSEDSDTDELVTFLFDGRKPKQTLVQICRMIDCAPAVVREAGSMQALLNVWKNRRYMDVT